MTAPLLTGTKVLWMPTCQTERDACAQVAPGCYARHLAELLLGCTSMNEVDTCRSCCRVAPA